MGIERARPLSSVRANFTVTLSQSRFSNDVMVEAFLRQTLNLYNASAEAGVFGQFFNGYLKTKLVTERFHAH